jgi:hypothetical protein
LQLHGLLHFVVAVQIWLAHATLATASGLPVLQPALKGNTVLNNAHRSKTVKVLSIRTRICAHSFRAAGITTYLQNGGELEEAQQPAGIERQEKSYCAEKRKRVSSAPIPHPWQAAKIFLRFCPSIRPHASLIRLFHESESTESAASRRYGIYNSVSCAVR